MPNVKVIDQIRVFSSCKFEWTIKFLFFFFGFWLHSWQWRVFFGVSFTSSSVVGRTCVLWHWFSMLCLFVVCSNKLFQHCRFVFSNRNEDHANNGSNTPSSITLKAARWLLELSSTTKETHTFHSVFSEWHEICCALQPTNNLSFTNQKGQSQICTVKLWLCVRRIQKLSRS